MNGVFDIDSFELTITHIIKDKGDYRRQVYGTKKPPASMYKIDKEALAKACDHVGVARDARVIIRRLHGAGHYVGTRKNVHLITLNPYLHISEAEKTVWHELVHAAQAERIGSQQLYDLLYTRQVEKAGIKAEAFSRAFSPEEVKAYKTIPFENEAFEMEENIPEGIRVCILR